MARILKGPIELKGELGLENDGVSAFLDTLAGGGSGGVDPRPTTDDERRRSAEGVHDGGVAVMRTLYVNGENFPDGAVGVLLASGNEVDNRWSWLRLRCPPTLGRSKRSRERGGRRPMCTSFAASPVAVLTELF